MTEKGTRNLLEGTGLFYTTIWVVVNGCRHLPIVIELYVSYGSINLT